MIEDILDIFLITYNRAKDLDKTLKKLVESPFSKCQLTILDNCSSDETPQVCYKYKSIFNNLTVLRHSKNLGAGPNFLRAVELSKLKYTWVLCDDDLLNFDNSTDIIKALELKDYDIICVGSSIKSNWVRGSVSTSKKLMDEYKNYFIIFSFIPGFIYKTNLYDEKCINQGYQNVNNLFPHFPFINKSFEENFSVYVSEQEIIIRGQDNPAGFSGLNWLIGWMNSCLYIENKTVRKTTVRNIASKTSFTRMALSYIALEKMRNDQSPYINITQFFSSAILVFGLDKNLLILFFLIPLIILPKFFYKIFINVYLFFKYTIHNKNPPETIKVNDHIDESRRI